jgi:CheY-like chemotaxis protein
VDDSPLVLYLFGEVLRDAGYEVVEARTVSEAQKLATNGQQIDLLLTDHQMHPLSGVEFSEWFRSKHPGVPVIVTTALPQHAVLNRSLDGSLACVRKPSSPAELTDLVAAMLTSRAA